MQMQCTKHKTSNFRPLRFTRGGKYYQSNTILICDDCIKQVAEPIISPKPKTKEVK